jgi:hypothetical protein
MSNLSAQAMMSAQVQKLFSKPDVVPATDGPFRQEFATEKLAGEEAPVEAASAPPVAAAAPAAPKAAPEPNAELVALQKQVAELTKLLTKQAKAAEPVAPARVTNKSLEAQLEEMRAESQTDRELAKIERELPKTPEYASLSHVPDLAQLVLESLRDAQARARENGEGERSVTVAQVTKALKEQFVTSLKAHLANGDLAKDVGMGASSQQATSRQETRRTLTSDMTAQGGKQTTTGTTVNDLLQQQALKAARLLNG